MSDPHNPRMRVDFPRWEGGDPIGWISCVEQYFRYHRTTDASMVEITAIHLEGDVIQWFNWFEYTHGGLSWRQFKEGLLIRFEPTDYENIDGQLEKIRQTSTIQEYQTSPQPSTVNRAPAPKKLTREKLRERSAKGLCWHYDKLWSREHRCKKGRLLVIEPVEEVMEPSEESLGHKEEDAEEEPQPTDFTVQALASYSNPQIMKVGGLLEQQPIIVLIDTGSTNNFLNSKVAARMALHIEGCSKFDVKVANDRILKCDQRCRR
ncbi:hypothetical protein B296_00003555 [Ensete ventricosum]|uniref:Retrotransposon gag domain-containing protein n=1 Tax=Ensete ventricosum TaxID=4639 RepID=A0A427AE00_ENSVE|nr:hypothetical protein B296_00003555 [Ensete ventricosum]